MSYHKESYREEPQPAEETPDDVLSYHHHRDTDLQYPVSHIYHEAMEPADDVGSGEYCREYGLPD